MEKKVIIKTEKKEAYSAPELEVYALHMDISFTATGDVPPGGGEGTGDDTEPSF